MRENLDHLKINKEKEMKGREILDYINFSYHTNSARASQSYSLHTMEDQNLTPLDFAEIVIFLYKSSMLNIIQKKLHQYLL